MFDRSERASAGLHGLMLTPAIEGQLAEFEAGLPGMPDQLPFEFDLDEDEPRERYEGPMRFVTSVSQLKMFSPSAKGCPRKWAMHYLAGFPREKTQALIDGIRLHKSIKERWGILGDARADGEWSVKWQQDAKIKDLALALMRRVPDPARWISEPTYFLEVPHLDTAIFIKPDLMRPLERCDGFKDWKSTSARHKRSPWVLQDPSWWPLGKLPEAANGDTYFSLKNDIQFRVYSHGLMKLTGQDDIKGEWLYGSKKFKSPEQPTTWSCVATAQEAETRDWCEAYVWPLIATMNALRTWWDEKRLDSALLVPHNAFSCSHQGKFCDLLGHCNFWKSPVGLEKLHLPVQPA
jgi:hypothetical protein